MKLTNNFNLSEFSSKDGMPIPLEVIKNLTRLSMNLQRLRNYLNAPIKINSGYRSPQHNKKIGGATNSFHVKGMAADIVVNGYSPEQVFDAIETLQEKGEMTIGGLHAYETFVHYDIRNHKARW